MLGFGSQGDFDSPIQKAAKSRCDPVEDKGLAPAQSSSNLCDAPVRILRYTTTSRQPPSQSIPQKVQTLPSRVQPPHTSPPNTEIFSGNMDRWRVLGNWAHRPVKCAGGRVLSMLGSRSPPACLVNRINSGESARPGDQRRASELVRTRITSHQLTNERASKSGCPKANCAFHLEVALFSFGTVGASPSCIDTTPPLIACI